MLTVSRKSVTAAVAISLAMCGSAYAGSLATWKPIGSASASGDFAIASANGTAKKPKALRVKVLGNTTADMTIIFSCSKEARLRPGQALVLGVAGSGSCDVIASGSGDGKLTVRIERLR
jgi:hypothetical protein